MSRVPAEGEFLHRDNREYLARGSPADSEDLYRRSSIVVGCREAIGCGEATAPRKEQVRQSRADRRIRRDSGVDPAPAMQRPVDTRARGNGSVESLATRAEQNAYHERRGYQISCLRSQDGHGDLEAKRRVRAAEPFSAGGEQELNRSLRGNTATSVATDERILQREEGRIDNSLQALFVEAEQGARRDCRCCEAAGGAGGRAGDGHGGEGDGGAKQLGGY